MKANAPEKIYVCIPDDDIVGTASTQKGFPHQFVTEEYIRADAFIEKAAEWLTENVEKHISADGEYTVYYEEMFEEFIKAMKGE